MSAAAPAEQAEADVLVGRCYTKARRHPLVIGKLPGGGQLLGGPYTVPQAIVIAVSFTLLILLRDVWAHFGLLNVLIAPGVAYGLGLVVRHVHVDGRGPLAAAGSLVGLLAAPSDGRIGGRPMKALRSHLAQGVCTVTWHTPASEPGAAPVALLRPAAAAAEDANEGPRSGSPAGTSAAAGPRARSWVGAALAAERG
ncbi:hypothetical protein RCO28_34230 [Streptomyces sp. LHD-70]|uniref:hypothetical protein n=1 Tax=Streptomyces sp. LHD-70 TaxID=3072140 RepID=UPI00280F1D73|nr:hypothetical protein [Streptomyces sp. LHD-70]MDQ8707491.1 hypothetical protein [Streptomyces sp. LHD-70]